MAADLRHARSVSVSDLRRAWGDARYKPGESALDGSQPALDCSQPALDRSRPAPTNDREAEHRRRELAAFLRSRRERITPEMAGLPPAPRRRTPGLRREEVATLAGVGITWYTWLEQGRDINASPQVLDAVARTLLLDPHERAHLFTLADTQDGTAVGECRSLAPTIPVLLRQLEPYPVCVRNARYDLLAYNSVYGRLIEDLDELPFEDRNALWLCFTNSAWRAAMIDWEEGSRRMVAEFRASMAEHVAEPAWKCLVSRLRAASPEFAELWERHDVAAPENRTKHVLNPHVGLLHLDYTNLWLGQRLGTRMITYTPADEETGARLRKLAELVAIRS
jgi:transcriptional regulator with XRE-family HTH domain